MAILSKGQTFADGDQVTSTKLNNIVDNATFKTGAGEAVDGTTLLVDAGGYLKVGTVQTGNIAANAITTSKIADSTGASDGITTAKLATGSVTTAKIADSTGASDGITTAKIATGAVTTAKLADDSVTADKINGLAGSAPVFYARAWARITPYVGGVRTGAYKSGTYARSATNTEVTIANHGLRVNDKIRLDFTSGTSGTATDGLYTVTAVDSTSKFIIAHTGTVTTGNVTAQFVAIEASGNVSSASFYDSNDDSIVINFTTPMNDANYALIATSHLRTSSLIPSENTNGYTKLNTVYNANIYCANQPGFISVVVFQ